MDAVERIFSLLKEKGIEQKAFAHMVGTTDKTISAWRCGRSKSYTKYFPQIAEALDTSVEYLLTGIEPKKEPTGCTDGLNADESALLDIFRGLSPEQQEFVVRIVQAAADQGKQ